MACRQRGLGEIDPMPRLAPVMNQIFWLLMASPSSGADGLRHHSDGAFKMSSEANSGCTTHGTSIRSAGPSVRYHGVEDRCYAALAITQLP